MHSSEDSFVQKKLLKCYEKGVAWPSVYLAALTAFIFLLTAILGFTGQIPLWLGLIINTIVLVYSFIPLHDATHGSISGRDKSKLWLNDLVGHITGIMLLYEYRAYRNLHRLHHLYPKILKTIPTTGLRPKHHWELFSTPSLLSAITSFSSFEMSYSSRLKKAI